MNYPQVPGQYPQHWPQGQPQHGQPQQPYWPPQQHQPQPQQPYPPQQYAPQGYGQPREGIAVTTQFFPLAFMMAFFNPKILIDGYEVPVTGWGRTVVPARPGQHRVHVHVPYFLPSQIGPADTLVDVYPGHLVELEYKAPVWAFSAGSLGSGPQSYNGVGTTVAVVAIAFAFALLFALMLLLIAI